MLIIYYKFARNNKKYYKNEHSIKMLKNNIPFKERKKLHRDRAGWIRHKPEDSCL